MTDERTWNELVALRASVEGYRNEVREAREAQEQACRACQESTASQVRRLSHRADVTDKTVTRHIQDHGQDPADVREPLEHPRTSIWIAPTAQHVYDGRWRILVGLLILLGASLPKAWPYLREAGRLLR